MDCPFIFRDAANSAHLHQLVSAHRLYNRSCHCEDGCTAIGLQGFGMQTWRWFTGKSFLHLVVRIDLFSVSHADIAGVVDATLGGCAAAIALGLVNHALNVV